VLHRDLKPGNVMLGKYGETLVVDWGLAKSSGEWRVASGEKERTLAPRSADGVAVTQQGSVLGTPAFMSPEQATGQVDQLGPASDIYSLGATLYVLLTGQPPFRGENAFEVLEKVRRGHLVAPRRVKRDTPAALEAICLKAMALKPGDRYATALDLAAEVEHWLADEPVAAYAEPWSVRAGRWLRKHRTLAGISAATLLLAVVFLGALALLIERQKSELAGQNLALEEANTRERTAAELAQKTIEDMTSPEALKFLETVKELQPEQKKFLEEALAYYRQSTERTPINEREVTRQANAYFRIGFLQKRLGFVEPAVDSYRAAIESLERLAGEHPQVPEYRNDLARSHNNLGVLLAAMGKRDDAEREYRAALKEQERLAGEHPQVPEQPASDVGVTRFRGQVDCTCEITLREFPGVGKEVGPSPVPVNVRIRHALQGAGVILDGFRVLAEFHSHLSPAAEDVGLSFSTLPQILIEGVLSSFEASQCQKSTSTHLVGHWLMRT
jgi:serine/threonine-protein kinase